MLQSLRSVAERFYERVLISELSETPTHVAVIQDGNRRYARQQGKEKTEGHQAGAETTEALLNWCDELGIEEVTLYAFSTENFNRSEEEREHLFDLISDKLREFADADRVHESEVRIRAIGDTERLPDRVLDAISYAEEHTGSYNSLYLNVALAYGGRAELLDAARSIASDVAAGEVDPAEVDVETVETALYDGPTQDVDLIVRTGGDERTSNFLPWQANGNEAAVYFSTPYWPEFRKIDFLRSIRTYEHREESWRQTRAKRAKAVIRTLGPGRSPTARSTLERLREQPEYADDAAEDATPGGNIDPAD
jgi:tritrans,polycis-undecaprenyl-diphosphate synthase [geranylgeranyl-diphosphate specific]